MRAIIFSIAISLSSNAFSEQITPKKELILRPSDVSIICRNILTNYMASKKRLEEFGGMPFVEAYPQLRCKSRADNLREWQLLGQALTSPPSKLAFAEANRMLREMKKEGHTDLLKFMFTHKDKRGRTVYDYITLLEGKYPNSLKYYRKFRTLFKRYDIWNN